MGTFTDHSEALRPSLFRSGDLDRLAQAFDCEITPCGSRYTNNPAPLTTDIDYLVVCPPGTVKDFNHGLDKRGWTAESWGKSYGGRSGFYSWRFEEINLIVTDNAEFARRHKAATALCKLLNLQEKFLRVSLFQAVLYGEIYQ